MRVFSVNPITFITAKVAMSDTGTVIVVRANPDGSLLRLRDIGRVDLGSSSYSIRSGSSHTRMLYSPEPNASTCPTPSMRDSSSTMFSWA